MHPDELEIPLELVSRLVAEQFPAWAGLEIEPTLPWGADNALFRLGEDKLARLPRIEAAAGQVAKDARWLPVLAPQLPLAIPEVLATGAPAAGYPWTWGVYRRLAGATAPPAEIGKAVGAAADLAAFLAALQRIDTTGGPPGSGRGVPLGPRDSAVQQAIHRLGGDVDAALVRRIWASAAAAGGPVHATWIHGDLMPGNLLLVDRRLSAVIDFSCLCVGDAASDLMVAWWFLGAEERAALRSALAVDDAAWLRGCGWALSCALIAIPYYSETNPVFAAYARRTLDEIVGDPPV
jgi:aminoglycoside phosphotransferase (APT) family kinase protein